MDTISLGFIPGENIIKNIDGQIYAISVTGNHIYQAHLRDLYLTGTRDPEHSLQSHSTNLAGKLVLSQFSKAGRKDYNYLAFPS